MASRTYVFLGDIPDIPDVHDLALVPHHAHGDGVLTHLRGNVAVHLNAQVLQHKEACREQGCGGRRRGKRTPHPLSGPAQGLGQRRGGGVICPFPGVWEPLYQGWTVVGCRLLTPLPSDPHTKPKHTARRVRPLGTSLDPPVAMPSKSESTRIGFLFSAGTGG